MQRSHLRLADDCYRAMKVLPSAVSTCCCMAASNLEFRGDTTSPLALMLDSQYLRYLYSVQYPVKYGEAHKIHSWGFSEDCKGFVRKCESVICVLSKRVHSESKITALFISGRLALVKTYFYLLCSTTYFWKEPSDNTHWTLKALSPF